MGLTSSLDQRSRVVYLSKSLYFMRKNNLWGLCRTRKNILQNWECGCRFMERAYLRGRETQTRIYGTHSPHAAIFLLFNIWQFYMFCFQSQKTWYWESAAPSWNLKCPYSKRLKSNFCGQLTNIHSEDISTWIRIFSEIRIRSFFTYSTVLLSMAFTVALLTVGSCTLAFVPFSKHFQGSL